MKVTKVQFLEAVESPDPKAGLIDKFKAVDGDGKVSCRAVAGQGLMLELPGSSDAVIVPWANVKFARVRIEESDGKAGKR